MIPFILAFAAGLFTWTFLEYAMHNWLGHLSKGRNEFSRQHLSHHANTDTFAPPSSKAAMATPILVLLGVLASLPLGWGLGTTYALGVTTLYVFYEVLHRRTHTHAPWEPYGRWARKHHLHHHFCSPKANHGVTSPLWDVVFGTYERPSVVPIPPKQEKGVLWLLDERSELAATYSADYRLCRR